MMKANPLPRTLRTMNDLEPGVGNTV